jgi:hypothetical protein
VNKGDGFIFSGHFTRLYPPEKIEENKSVPRTGREGVICRCRWHCRVTNDDPVPDAMNLLFETAVLLLAAALAAPFDKISLHGQWLYGYTDQVPVM